MNIDKNIDDFDAFLNARGLKFNGIVVGGAALVMNGTVNRATDDVDIIAPEIPKAVIEAAREFANERSTSEDRIRGIGSTTVQVPLSTYYPTGGATN